MNKRCIIWLSVLIVIGGAGLGWVVFEKIHQDRATAHYKAAYGGDIEDILDEYSQWAQLSPDEKADSPLMPGMFRDDDNEQTQKDQIGRLKANLASLASGQGEVPFSADLVYGSGWQEKVHAYKQKQMILNDVAIASSVCVLAVLSIVFGWGVKLGIGAAVNKFKGRKNGKEAEFEFLMDADEIQCQEEEAEEEENKEEPKKKTGWGGLIFHAEAETEKPQEVEENNEQKRQGLKDVLGMKGIQTKHEAFKFTQMPIEAKAAAMLLSDEPVTEPVVEAAEPVSNGLSELTQEVSAIREFAAQQQDRVRQLQEGYDWTIIKRFCLRIIRCADNLDGRIEKLAEKGEEVACLEDVRDELIFALESSGVEQFEPETDKSYKGQEKLSEAIREREPCDNAELSGMVAKVVRCGYKYVLNENDEKIVRAAQVKLYT